MSFAFFQSLCKLNFFKSSDLRKTSLNRSPRPQQPLDTDKGDPEIPLLLPRQESVRVKKSCYYENKREVDTPVRPDKEKTSVTERDFRIMQILRSGKNWRTYMVRKENEDRTYAMKLIGKRRITKNSIEDQVAMEKDILVKAKHPFIPKLDCYFENEKKLFLVMEFVDGKGSLKHFLKQYTRFSEEITRFYSAEILLTLEYLHNDLQVAYGDVRLRNFLLDLQGHIKLLDYSQAKKLIPCESPKDQSSNSQYNDKEASVEEMNDFWGFGRLIYELLTGRKPFSESETAGAELVSPTSQLCWPCPVSKNAKDLITRLLNRDTEKRLGYNGIEEIKKHPFFAQVNWEKMYNKAIYPPLVPSQIQNDKDYDDFEDEESDEVSPKDLRASSLDKIIEGSSYLNSDGGLDTTSFDRTTTGLSSMMGH